jgi:hypothetical protein
VVVVVNTIQILRSIMRMQLQPTMDKRLDVLLEGLPVRVETVVVTAVLLEEVDSIPTVVTAFMVLADNPSQMEVTEVTTHHKPRA